jgi:hypothetical protein
MNERKILAAARYRPLELGGRGSIDAHAANYSSSLDDVGVNPSPAPYQICYHFVDKYHYIGFNDVEFVGQSLW